MWKERKGAHLIIDGRREEGETDRRSGVLSIKSHLISHRFICYCCPKNPNDLHILSLLYSLQPWQHFAAYWSNKVSSVTAHLWFIASSNTSLLSSLLCSPAPSLAHLSHDKLSLSLSPPIFLCFRKSVLEICSCFRIYPHIHFLCIPHPLSKNIFRVIGFLSTSYQPTTDVPLLVHIDRSIAQTENRWGSVSSLS